MTSMHESPEARAFQDWLQATPYTEAMTYSLMGHIFEFLADFLHKESEVSKSSIDLLVAGLSFKESGLRDRAKRALTRLMMRHHKLLRKSLIEASQRFKDEQTQSEIDQVLKQLMSPLYFDYTGFDQVESDDSSQSG